MRPILWLMEPAERCSRLAKFLQELLQVREVLANRALHLFLQTKLSVKVNFLSLSCSLGTRDSTVDFQIIKDNLTGNADDEVMSFSSSDPGFHELF